MGRFTSSTRYATLGYLISLFLTVFTALYIVSQVSNRTYVIISIFIAIIITSNILAKLYILLFLSK